MNPARTDRTPSPARGRRPGFTLIELILVMALLVAVAAMIAPALGGFFRGRAIDAEARRFVTLSRYARSAAIAEGNPMLLWVDPLNGTYGLVEEVNYTGNEPRRLEYTLEQKLNLEADPAGIATTTGSLLGRLAWGASGLLTSRTLTSAARSGLTVIRFQPDGFLDPASPTALWLRERDPSGRLPDGPGPGFVWITQTLNRTGYEIQTNQFAWVRR